MYLMYVDESGDCGITGSKTPYFVLTGMVVHELHWHDCLENLIDFRRQLRSNFGLRLREEIHASQMIARTGKELARIHKADRLTILRLFAKRLAGNAEIRLINVIVNKGTKDPTYPVFEMAWKALVQRFENTIRYRNFPGPHNTDERGLLLPDRTDEKKLRDLLRRGRRWNPVPNQAEYGMGYRNLVLQRIVEDPVFKDSDHSYFIQACDLCAYLLYQHYAPNIYMRRKGGKAYFNLLAPILCKAASASDPRGIVWL